jgi:hypothetical protein
MRLLRAIGPLVGLLAVLGAMPAEAADNPLQVSGSQRWDIVPTAGSWSPYSITLKNQGDSDFTGYVALIPVRAQANLGQPPTSIEGWPNYRQRVTIPRGTEKVVHLYTAEAPNGYRLEVQDSRGNVVTATDLRRSVSNSAVAFGLLSDLRGADDILNKLYASSQRGILVTQFPAQSFPTNAVYLSGLQGIVIDNFDSESLSQAQRQALREFVGFGGSLIVAGGSKWRRTVLPLPSELTPLRPTETAVVSLNALADLAAARTDAQASVMAGELKSGRAVLWSGNDPPLLVEGTFGSGRIVEMTFDPFDEPLVATSNPPLAAVAWNHAVARALGPGATNSSGYPPGKVGPAGGAAQAGSRPMASTSGSPPVAAGGPSVQQPKPTTQVEDQVFGLLRDTPAASAPPLALLGGLLVAYVLLVGPLNYMVFSAARRRELLWVSVPVAAIFFTVSAYGFGVGLRGQDFYDNEVQIQRLAPGGAVSISSYHGLFSPYKGDYRLVLAPNTLATTVIGSNSYYNYLGNSQTDTVTIDNRSVVDIRNVSVWQMRTVQTLTVGHSNAAVDTSLRQADAKFKGSIVNRGSIPLTDVRLVSSDGRQAFLAPVLAPGAVANVDADISYLPGISSPVVQRGGPPSGAGPSDTVNPDRKQGTLDVAALSVQSRAGEYFLIGLVDPKPILEITAARPNHSAIAALIIPIRMDAVDQLANAAPARLIYSALQVPTNYLDVYDVDIPTGISGQLLLQYSLPYLNAASVQKGMSRGTVEVFDFSAGTWRQLDVPPATSVTTNKAALRAGETSAGLVRVRVKEATPNSESLSLVKAAA